jgi:hypothetical protein
MKDRMKKTPIYVKQKRENEAAMDALYTKSGTGLSEQGLKQYARFFLTV